jgi:hypothetical protein
MKKMARECRFCGSLLDAGTRVCPVCGMRVMGFRARGAALREASPPDLPAGAGLFLAGMVMLAGSFLPWVSNSFGEALSGVGFAGAGISTAVIGGCLMAMGAWSATVSGSRGLFVAGMSLALTAAALIAVYAAGTYMYMGEQASQGLQLANREFVSLQGGMVVAAAGAALGTAGAAFGWLRSRKRRHPGGGQGSIAGLA